MFTPAFNSPFSYISSCNRAFDALEKITAFSSSQWHVVSASDDSEPLVLFHVDNNNDGFKYAGQTMGGAKTLSWRGFRLFLLGGVTLAILQLALKKDVISFYLEHQTQSSLSAAFKDAVPPDVAATITKQMVSYEKVYSACSVSLLALSFFTKCCRRLSTRMILISDQKGNKAPQSTQPCVTAIAQLSNSTPDHLTNPTPETTSRSRAPSSPTNSQSGSSGETDTFTEHYLSAQSGPPKTHSDTLSSPTVLSDEENSVLTHDTYSPLPFQLGNLPNKSIPKLVHGAAPRHRSGVNVGRTSFSPTSSTNDSMQSFATPQKSSKGPSGVYAASGTGLSDLSLDPIEVIEQTFFVYYMFSLREPRYSKTPNGEYLVSHMSPNSEKEELLLVYFTNLDEVLREPVGSRVVQYSHVAISENYEKLGEVEQSTFALDQEANSPFGVQSYHTQSIRQCKRSSITPSPVKNYVNTDNRLSPHFAGLSPEKQSLEELQSAADDSVHEHSPCSGDNSDVKPWIVFQRLMDKNVQFSQQPVENRPNIQASQVATPSHQALAVTTLNTITENKQGAYRQITRSAMKTPASNRSNIRRGPLETVAATKSNPHYMESTEASKRQQYSSVKPDMIPSALNTARTPGKKNVKG